MDIRCIEILSKIAQLSSDCSVDHKAAIDVLKQEYNRILMETYNANLVQSYDPIETLPPEVWVQVIQEVLPTRDYARELLSLTTVSKNWQYSLLSTPILWAHIQVRGSEEDSLAIVETFRHLSDNIPLTLTIYVPMRHSSDTIESILANIGPRLREVVIADDDGSGHYVDDDVVLAVNVLLRSPQHVSGVVGIRFKLKGPSRPIHPPRVADLMKDSSLPPAIRRINGWCFHQQELLASVQAFQWIEEVDYCAPIDDIIAHLSALPRLRLLRNTHMGLSSPPQIPTSRASLPTFSNLTNITYTGHFRTTIISIIEMVAPHMLELRMRTPLARVAPIQALLGNMRRIQTLSLRIDHWDAMDEGTADVSPILGTPDSRASVPSLRTLGIFVLRDLPRAEIESESPIMCQLISTFAILYKQVQAMDLELLNARHVLSPLVKYVLELKMLRQLSLNGNREEIVFVQKSNLLLPSLETLDAGSTNFLHCLDPQLIHHLRMNITPFNQHEGSLIRVDTRKLSITQNIGKSVVLPPGDFPSLTELTATFGQSGKLQLSPLSSLTTISIAADPDALQATALCFALLYQPEACPALNNIRLLQCAPEWDVLFLMLERRNFLPNPRISRIRKIRLPFILDDLRAPLASLLRGIFTARPSNEELCFNISRELIFNENSSGCYVCMRGMLRGCKAFVQAPGFRSMKGSIYSTKDDPAPLNMDVNGLRWIEQREALLESWDADLEAWEIQHGRIQYCTYNYGSVEITEHDLMG